MKNPNSIEPTSQMERSIVEAAIKIGLIFLLVSWSLDIINPFINLVIWGMVLAVAIYPLFLKLKKMLKGSGKWAATAITLLGLMILILPTILLFESLVEWGGGLAESLMNGKVDIAPPPDKVAEWPLVGKSISKFWSLASVNLAAALTQIGPQLKDAGMWLFSAITGIGTGVVQFIISTIIAGVLMAYGQEGADAARKILVRVAGERGNEYCDLSAATIRSVAQGVLGVAVIQAILCGLGFLVAGIPGAGFWTILVLVLAIVQLPATLVTIPIIIYAFSALSPVAAIVFAIWSIFAGLSDNVLKPILLGRGVPVPMLVILLGSIGGMILSGIIGLFLGAVILSLAFKLFMAWLDPEAGTAEDDTSHAPELAAESPEEA